MESIVTNIFHNVGNTTFYTVENNNVVSYFSKVVTIFRILLFRWNYLYFVCWKQPYKNDNFFSHQNYLALLEKQTFQIMNPKHFIAYLT